MAIVPLKKVTLMGVQENKEQTLADVQALGVMHVIPLSCPADKSEDGRRRDVFEALKYLSDCPDRFNVRYHAEHSFDLEDVVAKALENKRQTKAMQEYRLSLKKTIENELPWGNFDLPAFDDLGGNYLFFYQVPKAKVKKLPQGGDVVWQCVHKDSRYAYVVVIAPEAPKKGVMPVDRLGKNPEKLDALQREFEDVRIRLDDLAVERRRLTQWIRFILRDMNMAEDEALRAYVSMQTYDENEFFVLQGWIPETSLDDFKRLADQPHMGMAIEEPSEGDAVPTLLRNKGAAASGEEIVKFYQYPGYKEWDPSAVIFLSFAVFFGIILADAGYSALIGVLMILFWKGMGKSETGRRMRRLGLALSGVGIVMGTLMGSVFGFTLPALEQFALVDVNDFDFMMKAAIGLGVVHLSLANLVNAWQGRHSLSALAPLGWVVTIVSGLGLWLLGSDIQPLKHAMIAGLTAVVMFASSRPYTSIKNIALRAFDGLAALTNISKAFGDALSYMRLFALALAGSSLSVTFNDMAMQAHDAFPAFGMVAAGVILLIGHSINFILSIIGGVIHGLRLNLIEFANWSLFDEGKPYQPFYLKEQ